MSDTPISPSFDAVETAEGVRYRLRTSGNDVSNVLLFLGFLLRLPLAGAGLAAWFLWQHAARVSPWLTVFAGVFVAQMLFVARLPWILFRQHLWHELIARGGHGEIELRGETLFSGNRLGVIRAGQRRRVRAIQRIVVYAYTFASTDVPVDRGPEQQEPEEAERAVLAIETDSERRWLLVDGLSRSETCALAEDLHRRIAAVRARNTSAPPLPAPVVTETQANDLYPPLTAEDYRRRKPWWLAMHCSGALGLACLTAIAIKVGAWSASAVKLSILLAWFVEVALIAFSVWLPVNVESESELK